MLDTSHHSMITCIKMQKLSFVPWNSCLLFLSHPTGYQLDLLLCQWCLVCLCILCHDAFRRRQFLVIKWLMNRQQRLHGGNSETRRLGGMQTTPWCCKVAEQKTGEMLWSQVSLEWLLTSAMWTNHYESSICCFVIFQTSGTACYISFS